MFDLLRIHVIVVRSNILGVVVNRQEGHEFKKYYLNFNLEVLVNIHQISLKISFVPEMDLFRVVNWCNKRFLQSLHLMLLIGVLFLERGSRFFKLFGHFKVWLLPCE